MGVYRPPNVPNQNYEEDLKELLEPNRKENVSTIIAGDLNLNTWGKGYENWVEEENIWVLANPAEPTHESGTTDDTMLFVAGDYIPEGILPGEAESDKELQTEEYFPVHTTEKNVIRDHMAQTLTLQTVRPDARSDCKRYNVRGMGKKDWEEQQTELVALQDFREMQKLLAKDPGGQEGIHPAALYDKLNKVLRKAFAEKYAKPKRFENRNDTKAFIKNNKQHGKIEEYEKLIKGQHYKECGEIQREIARDNWRNFLGSAKIADLKEIYLYLARAEGRKPTGYKPSCLDPLQDEEGNLLFHPKAKADRLGRFFEEKLTQKDDKGNKIPLKEIQEQTKKRPKEGVLEASETHHSGRSEPGDKRPPKEQSAGPGSIPGRNIQELHCTGGNTSEPLHKNGGMGLRTKAGEEFLHSASG